MPSEDVPTAEPLLTWPDGQPYEILASAGVGPSSTMAEVRDASFALMEARAFGRAQRLAWDALKSVPQRLAVDFMMLLGPGATQLGSSTDE